jgi:hypothetical protein
MNKRSPSLAFTGPSKTVFPGFPRSPRSRSDADAGLSSGNARPYTKFVLGPPVVQIELAIGETGGRRTEVLTFHEKETADGAARRFCDAHRLPNSAVEDVRVVLEETLRSNAVERARRSDAAGTDDSFQENLSVLFGDVKTHRTRADLAREETVTYGVPVRGKRCAA